MRSPCDPPKFDEQDWSQFDFSRWHVDGVKLDGTAAAVVDLSERLFNSDEWRRHFQATVPELQRRVLDFYRGQKQQLQDERTAVGLDLEQRAEEARTRAQDYRRSLETAAAPPTAEADPQTFRLGVKVISKEERLGLPGLIVRLIDPGNQQVALVEGFTDDDGNAVLSVPPEMAKEFDKTHTALHVIGAEGKLLQELPGAVCIRLNQTETQVLALTDSPDVEAHKTAALQAISERRARADHLAARVDRLKEEREARLRDVDCRLQETEAIIAALERAPEPPPEEPPSRPGPLPRPEPGAGSPPVASPPPGGRPAPGAGQPPGTSQPPGTRPAPAAPPGRPPDTVTPSGTTRPRDAVPAPAEPVKEQEPPRKGTAQKRRSPPKKRGRR